MFPRILALSLISLWYTNACEAVLYSYKHLLAHEDEPCVGISSRHVTVKLKALVTKDDKNFNPHTTKLNEYYSLHNIDKQEESLIVPMTKNTTEGWEVPKETFEQRFALCRDLFSQLGGWGCQTVDIHHIGHFRFDPFAGDKSPGAAFLAAKELLDLRNVLLRHGLFQKQLRELGFVFHHITNESMGSSTQEPSDLIKEWKTWTGGRIGVSGSGGGQTFSSLAYNLGFCSQKEEFMDKIKVKSTIFKNYDDLQKGDSGRVSYARFSDPLSIDQLNSLVQKIKPGILKNFLEVIEVTLLEGEELFHRIDKESLRQLTQDHGVFVKINLSQAKRSEFWNKVLSGGDNYYQYKVILSQPGEKLEIERAGPLFQEMNERFHWVYGN